MAADLGELLGDLDDETATLDAQLSGLSEARWGLQTPAKGWTIADQVSHLAYFDDAATLAATHPHRFTSEATALMEHGPHFADHIARTYRSLAPDQLLDWFHRSRNDLRSAFAELDPRTRLPWYGPPMSAASSVTARLMETWAHGTDIFETLGTSVRPSTRLRHIAHLGTRTLGFSFALHDLEVPDTPVFVELRAPDGAIWTWGEPTSCQRVSGSALDFCLVVTQRRHRADTSLTTQGDVAKQWLSVAQAFAGPPGEGRASKGVGLLAAPSPDPPKHLDERPEHGERRDQSVTP
jgi:uncharacterized protein (TIGR03084 family)